MTENSARVSSWRKRTKERLVKAFGSKCGCCGYATCVEALQFHHLDPEGKEASISFLTSNIKRWDKIVEEVRKCVMLCANCHSEVHAGVRSIPGDVKLFDESFAKYKKCDLAYQDACPVCGESKPNEQITCSVSCASRWNRGKFDWSKHDLSTLLVGRSINSVAKELGVSGAAITKRLRKLGLR